MVALIWLTDIVEKLILLGLLGLSIWSISIMIDRRRVFKEELNYDFQKLREMISEKKGMELKNLLGSYQGYLSHAIKVLAQGENSSSIEKELQSLAKAERLRLEKGLPVLGTLGSNAPFIGLFGTVLGIIRAFAYLGSQSGSGAVMSGVSQALYATAMGLLVAIPAVVAFNIYNQKIKVLQLQVESLKDLWLSQKKQ